MKQTLQEIKSATGEGNSSVHCKVNTNIDEHCDREGQCNILSAKEISEQETS